jgi:endonuclease/exonuclease/phosphatase family metal-dependent hydrolase
VGLQVPADFDHAASDECAFTPAAVETLESSSLPGDVLVQPWLSYSVTPAAVGTLESSSLPGDVLGQPWPSLSAFTPAAVGTLASSSLPGGIILPDLLPGIHIISEMAVGHPSAVTVPPQVASRPGDALVLPTPSTHSAPYGTLALSSAISPSRPVPGLPPLTAGLGLATISWLGPQGLKIVSWNMNGFLHSVDANLERLRLQQGRVLGLTRRYSIVILLETHGNIGHHNTLRSLLPGWGIYMSFHACLTAGGVIMLVHPSLMAMSPGITSHIIEPGRVMVLDFPHPTFSLRVAGIHCDCRHRPAARRALWRSLDGWRPSPKEGLFVMIGDFNSIARGDSRFYPATGMFVSPADHMEDILHEVFGQHLVELAQESFTRRGLDDGQLRVLSRIDRCFSNLDSLTALDCNARSGVEWPLSSGHDPSDHVPVFVVLQAPSARPSSPSVPPWIAQLPAFCSTVQLMLDYMPVALTAPQRVEHIKEAMCSAAIELRESSARFGATTIPEKLYWSTMALRALRRLDLSACRRYCAIVPELLLAISPDDGDISMQVLIELVQALSLSNLTALALEVEGDPDILPDEKVRRSAKIRRKSEAWGRTRRRLTLSALLGPDGAPILDDSEATAALCAAWAPTFSNTNFDEVGAARLLLHAAPPLDISPTPMDLVEFSNLVARTGNSAAGPDGISYAAWRNAPAICTQGLHELYLHIFDGADPASNFNSTTMIFIPKPSGDPLETLCSRLPGALRPISLANTDNKAIAMAFARPLGEVAARWCSGDQFGFIAGRSIWDAVMLFEAAALHLARRDGDAALIFIDFRAAFPSILHGWIRAVLFATGLPGSFIRAFLSLYIAVSATVRFGSGSSSSFPMLSGIRQGCPASGAIFALCIDPLLRRIYAWLPSPWSKLVAYADDLAIALRGARGLVAHLFDIIDEAEPATGLCINVGKSTLVPLWTTDIAAATLEVHATSPRLASLEVASFFKHLGVLVGPGALPTRWAAPIAKFLDRAISIKAAGGGLSDSIRMYGVLAVSTLQYLSQFCSPPVAIRKIEARAIARVTSSPLYAFPVSLGSGLQEIGLRPGLVHIEALAMAARARASASSQHLATILALTDVTADSMDDDVFLHDRWSQWRRESLTSGVRHILGVLARSPAAAAVLPGMGMQRRLYRALLPTTRALHPVEVIRARLSHWGFCGLELQRVVWFAELRLRQCAKLKLPSSLFWSLLRLWCNALPTSRRFRNQVRIEVCPFGCGSFGGDDIRHFAVCPLVFAAILPIIGGANSWPNISGIRSLFVLEPRTSSHEVVLGIAVADALVHIYLIYRRAPCPDLGVVGRAFNERLCTLMQWSTKVRAAVEAARGGNLLLAPLAAIG